MLEKTNTAWAWLAGKKTYICTAIAIAAVAANLMGYINEEQMNAILTAVGVGGMAALAHKGNRILTIAKELKVIGQEVPPKKSEVEKV